MYNLRDIYSTKCVINCVAKGTARKIKRFSHAS